MKYFTLAFALGLAPTITTAQSFAAPEGCTGVLSVQHKGCVAINVWQCEADDEGDQWIALIGEGGLFSVQKVDPEFQWLETYKPGSQEKLITPAPDAASMSELIENGLDTYRFTISKESGDETTVGFDTLTGESVSIDGVELLRTEFEGHTLDTNGDQMDESAGRQYISVKHRLFFFGEVWDPATPEQVLDMSPVEFIYPGEAGFFPAQPKFECGVIESSFQK